VSELTFAGAGVLRELRLSAAATERRPTMEQQVERLGRQLGLSGDAAMDAYFEAPNPDELSARGPDVPAGLWLVHDDGIYVMANAEGFQPVYARGYVAKSHGVWERSRAAVGGDDFCEFIPSDPEMMRLLAERGSTFTVLWSQDSYEVAV
jgi:hypothetical protein